MNAMKVIAISSEIVDKVRSTMQSPGYGHPVSAEIARGHGPCRHCLRPFRIGDDVRLLFTYNAFEGIASLAQPGPVFVHETSCERYSEHAGYPAELLWFDVVLDACDKDQMVRHRMTATGGTQASAIDSLMREESVRYVMVRDAKAGCYDFRVERMDTL